MSRRVAAAAFLLIAGLAQSHARPDGARVVPRVIERGHHHGYDLDTFAPTTQFWVSSASGSDANPGSQAKPFASLGHARDAVRALPAASKAQGVAVNVMSGDYATVAGAAVLTLTEEDSGAAGAPIVWRAADALPGSGVGAAPAPPRLLGGLVVPPKALTPWGGGAKGVLQANLTAALGLTEFGGMHTGGLGACTFDQTGVYVDGTPGVLARWPNIDVNVNGSGIDVWQWTHVKTAEKNPLAFVYADSHVSSWAAAPDAWLHGYWGEGWADQYVRVGAIDASSATLTLDNATRPFYPIKAKARFYGVNILSELDAPGEYFINRSTGMLYVLPPAGAASASPEVVVSVAPLVVNLTNTAYVAISGLDIMFARGSGLDARNVSNILISGCSISNHGTHGASMSGANSTLTQTTVRSVGCAATDVAGGDVPSLTRGYMTVSSCNISHYALWKRCYNPALGFSGVGNTFSGNTISDSPHTGITGGGVDNLFENNHLHDMCYEVTDSGAFYIGRSWALRGNVVRGNTFERVRQNQPTFLGASSVQATYFDDEISGNECYSNTYIDCHAGILLGGGRRTLIADNTFVRTGTGVLFDNRGMVGQWQHAYCMPGGNVENSTYMKQLNSLHYTQPPWSTAFPELLNITTDRPCVPVYNRITGNRYCKTPTFIDRDLATVQSWGSSMDNNTEFSSC